MLDKDKLIYLYIVQNMDANSVAKEMGCHANTVYRHLKNYGIKKDSKNIALSKFLNGAHLRSGGRYKYNPSKSDVDIIYMSHRQLKYAEYLDANVDVESWDFKLIRIPYYDRMVGRIRLFVVDFSVQSANGDWWVELKHGKNLRPTTGRLVAAHAAAKAGIKFRGLTDDELTKLKE